VAVAGVNEQTIRRAISGGQLPATKHRGAFRIAPADMAAWQADYEAGVPPDSAATTGPAAAPSAQSGGSGDDQVALTAAKDETIRELSADVAYLRQHLDQVTEQLDQSRRELAVLHQSTAIGLASLTSVSADQRQDAPERAPEPPGSTEGASESHPHPRGWRRC